ncbi:MAG: hypothetical protein WC763_01805 [Candidatus Paceibacterota bacterium]|jgi:phosphoribosylaminoimidazolecarboxamide formyltransferase/IMP cyclohydrolase
MSAKKSADKRALLSLFDKTGSETFAAKLIERGFDIISSGGTAKYLSERGIAVTDIAEITGYGPVLDHRVVTLAPQIHGALLATPEMYTELEELGWKTIDLLYVTFYPLEEELARPEATFASCIKKTDIGGPTLIRSANKGGNVIVMTDREDEGSVIEWIDAGSLDRSKFLFNLRAKAEVAAARYIGLSARVYERFGYKARTDFPKYMVKIGEKTVLLDLLAAGRAFNSMTAPVRIRSTVIENDLTCRQITDEERKLISQLADDYDASK